jgi:citrate lyase subunit beta/citryl-CoA lyase
MRSMLFIPADSEKKFARGQISGADGLIIDLEDSVAAAKRPEARKLAAQMLSTPHPKQKFYVRINPLYSGDTLKDLAAIMPARPDGIVFPKSTPEGTVELDHYLSAFEAAAGSEIGSTRIFCIATETAGAMFKLGGYEGCSKRLMGLSWGAEDLSAAIGAAHNRRPDGIYDDSFRLARALCLLGASAADVQPIDTVYTDFKNSDGLRNECLAARREGYTGKIAIHPDQVPVINEAFTPSAQEIDWAKKVVAVFAANPDSGTIGLEGKMLDRPHLVLAQRVLARTGN